MTKQFKAGDKVTGPGGTKFEVVNHSPGSNVVHVETAKGVKPFDSTYRHVDELSKSRGSSTKADDATPPADSPNPPAGSAGEQ